MLQDRFKGSPFFTPQTHYFGYEGRCAFPTNFDCDYCYGLGYNAAILISHEGTGLMSCIRNLHAEPRDWQACGYPLVSMMDLEVRKGKKTPVITKALVDLSGPLFKYWQAQKQTWSMQDHFCCPGPVQFEGDCCSSKPYLAVPPKDVYIRPLR